jgi:hypothetical protein
MSSARARLPSALAGRRNWRFGATRSREIYNTAVFSRDFMRPEADKEAIRRSESVGSSASALTLR